MSRSSRRRRALSTFLALGLVAGVGALASAASAYVPTPDLVFEMDPADKVANQNKYNSIVYPKAAVTESGRILASHELSMGEPQEQTLPVYRSDDHGESWDTFGVVDAPARMAAAGQTYFPLSEERVAELQIYTSAWTNPYLYVLPQDVGDFEKGDILLAALVSGDDIYYQDMKSADPSWQASTDGDRKDLALALYVSERESDGAEWQFVDIIDVGGWQANYGNTFSSQNTLKQQDPVWEPYVMVYEDQLVVYYTDEKDYTGYDPDTGVLELRSDWQTYQVPSTGADSGNQVLVHRTWDATAGAQWSERVIDHAGSTRHGELGGDRPGMANVVPTTDGKWIYTAEFGVAKLSDDPLRFWDAGPVPGLPVANWGSPVIIQIPDPVDPDQWALALNHGGSGDIWLNTSGRSDGEWVRLNTTLGSGFSRNLTYVPETGKVLMLRSGWDDYKVEFAHIDLGRSQGAYYRLVGADGQVLTQGASSEGEAGQNLALLYPDELDAAEPTAQRQLWHMQPKADGATTFLAKDSGRAMAIWGGSANVTTWVDDDGADKSWTVSAEDAEGFVTVEAHDGTCLTSGANATVAACDGSDAQRWRLELDVPPASALVERYANPDLALLEDGLLTLDASRQNVAGEELRADDSAHVLLYRGDTVVEHLEDVAFDDSARARVELDLDSLAPGEYRVAVVFDTLPMAWDTVEIGSGALDLTLLEQAIEDARAIENENFTEESWSELQDAIAAGESLLTVEDVTQAQVDEATAAIRAAVAGLVEVSDPDGTDDGDGDDGGGTADGDGDDGSVADGGTGGPGAGAEDGEAGGPAGDGGLPVTGAAGAGLLLALGALLLASGVAFRAVRQRRSVTSGS